LSVIVAMGSATSTIEATVRELVAQGQRVGVVSVALYRPFVIERFLAALPPSTRRVAVLDRTKEPGAVGEPLYLDVVAALAEGGRLTGCEVFGGRYGLSSKELSPAMVAAVYDALLQPSPRRHFSLGITDDVTHESLAFDARFELPEHDLYEAVLFGLGSDGSVGASKNTVKIVGDDGDLSVQGYFVYDSKKSGAVTVSHLRFGHRPFERTSSAVTSSICSSNCQCWSEPEPAPRCCSIALMARALGAISRGTCSRRSWPRACVCTSSTPTASLLKAVWAGTSTP
jgi:pyruvate-ferredoxin/flavodoxin oxidoreductase